MRTQKHRKRRATEVERRVAKDLKGRRTANSGAGDEKADVRVAHRKTVSGAGVRETTTWAFRVECKTTEASSYSLNYHDWNSLVDTALHSGEHPLFFIQLSTRSQPQDLVLMQTSLYKVLFQDWVSAPKSVERKSFTITQPLALRCLDGHCALTLARAPHKRRANLVTLTGYHRFRTALYILEGEVP